MANFVRDYVPLMKKRRIEIAVLGALILFAAAERPSLTGASLDLQSAVYQVEGFAPRRVETVRDLGIIAAKLLVTWID